jgi:sigma-E factor negative regulatory protein RseA
MKEQLSAMIDDAASSHECDGCVTRLRNDPELRATWDLYHLIGDALRGHAGLEVADQVRQRLALEPTVLAPRTLKRPARRAGWYALSAAASIAAVALVGWMALPLFDLSRESAPPTTALIAEPVPTAQGVTDYLLAHQRFSPSLAIGGIAPYIRTVSEEAGTR